MRPVTRADLRRVERSLGKRRSPDKRGRRSQHRPDYAITTGRLLWIIPDVRVLQRGAVVKRCIGSLAYRRAQLWILSRER